MMKIRVRDLRTVIREVLYKAWRTKRGKRIEPSVEVDADDTIDAGMKAAHIWGGMVDPMTIDVEEVSAAQGTRTKEHLRDQVEQKLDAFISVFKILKPTDAGPWKNHRVVSRYLPLFDGARRDMHKLVDMFQDLGMGDEWEVLHDDMEYVARTLDNDDAGHTTNVLQRLLKLFKSLKFPS